MSNITIGLVAMSVILLSLATSGRGSPKTRAVTERDAGSNLKLSLGGILKVTLVGNPSTGFMWELQSLDTTILKKMGDWEFKADNSTRGFAGSPGKLTLRFEAIGSGQTTLQLIYRQPFDPVTPPARIFEMTVVVK
jgi:predicted secreted protein